MLANRSTRIILVLFTLVAGVILSCPTPAVAAVLTWTLHDVTFDDGGTAQGTSSTTPTRTRFPT